MTTNQPQTELDKILTKLDRGEYLGEGGVNTARTAILDWHNKQILEIIGEDEDNAPDYDTDFVANRNYFKHQVYTLSDLEDARNTLKAEQRNKLKDSK